jgi:hypothetical protein
MQAREHLAVAGVPRVKYALSPRAMLASDAHGHTPADWLVICPEHDGSSRIWMTERALKVVEIRHDRTQARHEMGRGFVSQSVSQSSPKQPDQA